MSTKYRISIIGSGNVAYHLTHFFNDQGHTINSIYTRQAKGWMDDLASIKHRDHLDYKDEYADFIMVAVKDSAIAKVVSQLKNVQNALVLHTSGTVNLDVFKENEEISDYGIFYPFQSLQITRPFDLTSGNFLIECGDKINEEKLILLCKENNLSYHVLDSSQRALYHVAAVFASNFTNHMLTVSKQILDENNLDFKLLHSLINETVSKALIIEPKYAQTGPAIREDQATMDKHLSLLPSKELKEIYKIISTGIIETKNPNH